MYKEFMFTGYHIVFYSILYKQLHSKWRNILLQVRIINIRYIYKVIPEAHLLKIKVFTYKLEFVFYRNKPVISSFKYGSVELGKTAYEINRPFLVFNDETG